MKLPGYRSSGATTPYGNLFASHDVAMEGYFWRFTLPESGRVVIALAGINRAADGHWSTLAIAAHPGGFLSDTEHPSGYADPDRLGAYADDAFRGTTHRVHADLEAARLDVRITDQRFWPRRRFGGSSYFQSVPALNQYWHPWLLGGRAEGTAIIDGEVWDLTGAQVYGEKNWGKGGFPDYWWWGQAQGFADPNACVAFAGGQISAGPLRTEVTAVVVALPDGTVFRLGNPVTSPVTTVVADDRWTLRGRNHLWSIEIEGSAPLSDAHILPVPLPSERRNVPGALEHLGATLTVTVRRRGAVYWTGTSHLAALEHGGLERAQAEVTRREQIAPDL
ncbi:tocopherol cyclase family protein [Rhodococcus sp. KBS0724]|uniref:tocopherol cyclase family protein n=1 Tax=Rhodococcus sp. KBS0724 TaxID=1179674 RepID=UPI0021B0A82C|nr:tocopherol cyclase family protein [Rhodococcus sp. KBS0724]